MWEPLRRHLGRRGRPREACYSCQPPGTRFVVAVRAMNDSRDLRPLAYLEAPK
jgi:hypothetical protein